MRLILAGIKFGEFAEFWRNSRNWIPAKILKNDQIKSSPDLKKNTIFFSKKIFYIRQFYTSKHKDDY